MEVYALIGPSGSGKSHRALMVANQYNISLVIDDGLLIKENKILAGKSAKREPSKIAAVKRAIFLEQNHSQEVSDALKEMPNERVLILGTSLNMVKRIVKELKLPKIKKVVEINEIATKKEMNLAQEQRLKLGKHVIPVPMIEVKPKFSGYLIESLELVLGIKDQQTKTEKTIVRPRFSYYGKLLIHDNVLNQLIIHTVNEHSEVVRVPYLDTQKSEEGIKIIVYIECYYGHYLPTIGEEIQKTVKDVIEATTGLNVLEVNVNFTTMRVNR